jgi:hypothetical protein
MARSVAFGELQLMDPRGITYFPMPRLDNPNYRQPDYETYNDDVGERQTLDHAPSDLSFRHRLLHDAESALLVLTWLLIRAAPRDNTADDMSPDYSLACHRFFQPAGNDPGPDIWAAAVHPGLAPIHDMLLNMHLYMEPEWAYRTDVKREDHTMEAMMRLLLVEIVRMKESGEHIPLKSELRDFPPRIKEIYRLERSTRAPGSVESGDSNNSGRGSLAGANSNEGQDKTDRPSLSPFEKEKVLELQRAPLVDELLLSASM